MIAALRPGSHRKDDGAAAVEFALVVPWLLLLLFGIIQFGITFAQILALNNGSRQAARAGVVGGATCSTVMAEALQGAQTIALQYPLAVTVTRGATTVCRGSVAGNGTVAYSTGAAGTTTCPPGSVSQSLNVSTVSNGSFTIPPFFFLSSFQVKGQGTYQCEIT